MLKSIGNWGLLTGILVGMLSANPVPAQELNGYELIDNANVGLTLAGFAKYGQCLVDIDNDGWADIYTVRYNGQGYSRIYRNIEGHFSDITAQSPLQEIEEAETRTFSVVWADYDDDGDKDCSFGTNLGLHLLRNDNNVFTDVAAEMGFVGQKPPGLITEWFYNVCGWADYDLDGDLDCAVFQQNYSNLYLFRNDGDSFTDVASEAGLDSTKLSVDAFMNPLVWTDWDMDGDPDLCGRQDFYANENGVFREVTEEIGLDGVSWTNYKEFFDYDNDGDLDYFKVTGRANEGENELWENRDGSFVNVSSEVGLEVVRNQFRSVSTGDFDNDGDQDVFIQLNVDANLDVLLLNEEVEPGVRVFADVAEFVGITKTGDRKGGGFFDYDNDGFLDIYVPSAEHTHILYHNLANNETNWVGFSLEGTVSNRDAIGSFITLYTGEKKQLRYTKAGGGLLRQDNPWVHFGLGFETSIDSVVIRWPLGEKQVLTDVAINQYHEVQEPVATSVESEHVVTTVSTFRLEQNYPNPFNPVTSIQYSLPQAAKVSLKIYNLRGEEIAVLIAGEFMPAGDHNVNWQGRDKNGQLVSTGIYVYQLRMGESTFTKKMAFIK